MRMASMRRGFVGNSFELIEVAPTRVTRGARSARHKEYPIPRATVVVCRIALSALFCAPALVSAEVVISEVAWMGTQRSANDEWMELYNTGDTAVDLTGWQLTAADGSPAIALEGSIAPKSYFLLERTDDTSVPSVVADLIYTGALGNDGEVLQLTEANGSVVDRVDGSDAWAIGGDNDTKATLSRSGRTWITAQATPGQENATEEMVSDERPESAQEEKGEQKETTPDHSDAAGDRSEPKAQAPAQDEADRDRPMPKPRLSVEVGDDRRASVGQKLSFEAIAFDYDGDRLRASYRWNFGDGTTAEGRRVEHVYGYEGAYVVQVTARTNLFREPLVARDRLVVTVESARVALKDVTEDYVAIVNQEGREVDLSGWRLVTNEEAFKLPEQSVLLPGATLMLSHTTTGLAADDGEQVALYYPSNILAAQYPPDQRERVLGGGTEQATENAVTRDRKRPAKDDTRAAGASVVREPVAQPRVAPPTKQPAQDIVPVQTQLAAESFAAEDATPKQSAPDASAREAGKNDESSSLMLWLLALGGVLGIGAAATLVMAREEQANEPLPAQRAPNIQTRAAEYEIIDETENDHEGAYDEDRGREAVRTPFPGGF